MELNWLLLAPNDNQSYIQHFNPAPHSANVTVQDGEPDFIYYLTPIPNEYYDAVMVSQEYVQNAPPEAYLHWLRVVKPNGKVYVQSNQIAPLEQAIMLANPVLSDLQPLGNHSFVMTKKSYSPTSQDYLLLHALQSEAKQEYGKALGLYQQAMAWYPNNWGIYQKLFLLYQRMGWAHLTEHISEQFYLCQQTPIAKILQAQLLLQNQDYPHGFKMREAALVDITFNKRTQYPPEGDNILAKKWKRQSLKGKTFVIWNEFGLGNEIMFMQLAHFFKRYLGAAKLIVLADVANVELFQTHPDIDLVLDAATWQTTLPDFDYWEFPYGLLARFDKPFKEIPKRHPYFFIPEAKRNTFENDFAESTRPRIGLAWRSSLKDAVRSITQITDLDTLIQNVPNVDWFCLQKDLSEEERAWLQQHHILHFADRLHTFIDTASIMSHLDFVVSTDNAVIHLAGAMNIPAAVILSSDAYDWRWGIVGKKHNLWYPSVLNIHAPHALATWQETLTLAAEVVREHIQTVR
ncbi:hypothetical protein MIS45_08630 [Wielerella bovis]|uniref:hypothetical protein n=1 Tax=Wielerella bovis TaxID=2917790 RepID=UPI00201845F8|nr:hypothetical protein [Wielerella bovis]ULJ68837.1 hypothetical protein MIS45_08630 [Wielerella bovis]